MEIHEFLKGFDTAALKPAERIHLVAVARDASASATERKTAMLRIIGDCVKIVIGIAMKYRRFGVPVTELAQEGIVLLQEIILGDNYDPTRVKLITYAKRGVEGVIADYATNNRVGGAPYLLNNNMQARLKRVRKAIAKLNCLLGKWPTVEQILDRVKLSDDTVSSQMDAEQVESCLRIIRDGNAIRLDAPLPGMDIPFVRAVTVRGANPEQAMALDDLRRESNLLRRALEEIATERSARDVDIFRLNCGLVPNGQPMRQNKIARIYDVSRERIRQIVDMIKRLARERTGMDETEIHAVVDFMVNTAPGLSAAA